MYGYDSAFIGGTIQLPSFQQAYGLAGRSKEEIASLSANIVSTLQGGAFFGCIFGFFLSESFGRKKIIGASGLIFSIGAALQMFGRIPMLYAGRVLTGLGVECSPALIRGRLVGIFEIMLQIALVFGFWVNYSVQRNIPDDTDRQWHIPVAVQIIPAGILMVCMPFVIESPRWLVSKGRNEEAIHSLAWVRNLPEEHPYVQHEFSEIQLATKNNADNGVASSFVTIIRESMKEGV
ncbi:unnamed protein product [Clonostachys byssicola]|uniref:Major facilitator superfamily (MFS) profile domain-containing protein n=1 Tax=Clonostachys byssicola TaxID=160290 RepID=A0A9N9UAM9_9HYPO|nr:unnamed protein product [Clonostachys byssicola]